jgi:hypothetical protein
MSKFDGLQNRRFIGFASADVLISIALAGYIALFCVLGVYAWPSADDYAFSVQVFEHGFWRTQWLTYVSVMGRCVATFLVTSVYFLGLKIYPFLAAANIILSLTVLCFLFRSIFKQNEPDFRQKTFLWALLFQCIWLAVVPELSETLYWVHGCVLYMCSAVLSLFCLSLLVRALQEDTSKHGTFFYPLLLAVFLNGMISELTCFSQIGILFLLTFYYIRHENSRSARTVCTALIAAVAGFLVMFFAPGNASRMSATMLSRFSVQNILQTLGVATVFGGVTAVKFFTKPIVYLAILYSPVIAAHVKPFDSALSKYLKAWHIFVLVALISPFLQAIAGFATGAGLPARAEGLAIWIMGAAWLSFWAFGYRNERVFEKIRSLRVFPWRGVLLALCLLLNGNFIALLQDLRSAPLYAAEQRQRGALVARQKAEGKTNIVVPALTVKPKLLFFTDIRPSPNDWKNQSFAEYWGVRSVSALPEELLHDEKARRGFQEGKLSGLEALALAGDAEAQFMLGEVYDATFAPADDVPKDNAAAAKWYRMAAERGHAHAQRRLTRFYALGMGVPKSYSRAVGWFLRSQF